ncbi:MFS quinate transporter [Purpureocillium lavendulum]|uniref:MFS quinate transporter n=1 Tax=Purpureocillium lavendulum TaxID=1247861 RepID=A0AB34FBI5_9HYPO|nr:MFS quinate transporter [Purpureocillium lavendulum]
MASVSEHQPPEIKIENMDDHATRPTLNMKDLVAKDKQKLLYWMWIATQDDANKEYCSDWHHKRANTHYLNSLDDLASIDLLEPKKHWSQIKIANAEGVVNPKIPPLDEIEIPSPPPRTPPRKIGSGSGDSGSGSGTSGGGSGGGGGTGSDGNAGSGTGSGTSGGGGGGGGTGSDGNAGSGSGSGTSGGGSGGGGTGSDGNAGSGGGGTGSDGNAGSGSGSGGSGGGGGGGGTGSDGNAGSGGGGTGSDGNAGSGSGSGTSGGGGGGGTGSDGNAGSGSGSGTSGGGGGGGTGSDGNAGSGSGSGGSGGGGGGGGTGSDGNAGSGSGSGTSGGGGGGGTGSDGNAGSGSGSGTSGGGTTRASGSPGALPIPSIEAPNPGQRASNGNGEAAPLMTSLASKRNLPGPGKPEAFHPNLWGRRCIVRYGRKEFPLHLVERSPYTAQRAEELGLETFGDGHTLGEKANGKIRVYQSPDFAGIYSVAWPTRLDREIDDDLEKLRPDKGKYVGFCWLRVGWKLKDDEGQYILDSNGEHVIKKCWESRSVLTAMWGPGTAALVYDLATASYRRYCQDQGKEWTPGRSVSPALLRGPSVVPDTGSGGNGPTSGDGGLFLRSSPAPSQNDNQTRNYVSRSPSAIPIPQSTQPAAPAEVHPSFGDVMAYLATPEGKAQIAAALASGQPPAGQRAPALPPHLLPQQVGAY